MVGRWRGAALGAVAGLVLAVTPVGIARAAETPSPAGSESASPGTSDSASPSGGASPSKTPSVSDIPILGQALVSGFGKAQERFPNMVLTVHGLRRTEGGPTVLYYSVGFLGDAPDPRVLPVTAYGSGPGTFGVLQASPGETFMDSAAAIDTRAGIAYAALRTASAESVSGPKPVELADRFRLSDRAVIQWIALAPVPADVKTVDLLVGSTFLQKIPVGDGLMTPTASERAPVAGTGWPKIDAAALKAGLADGTVLKVTSVITDRPAPPPEPSPSASTTPSPSGSAS